MSQKCKSYCKIQICCYLLLGDVAHISTIERESCWFTDLSILIRIPTYNRNISIVQCVEWRIGMFYWIGEINHHNKEWRQDILHVVEILTSWSNSLVKVSDHGFNPIKPYMLQKVSRVNKEMILICMASVFYTFIR